MSSTLFCKRSKVFTFISYNQVNLFIFSLRDLLLKGIGYHHAGLDSHDRHLTEELFTQGELLVLG